MTRLHSETSKPRPNLHHRPIRKPNNPIIQLILPLIPPPLLQTPRPTPDQLPIDPEIEPPEQLRERKLRRQVRHVLAYAIHRPDAEWTIRSLLRGQLLGRHAVRGRGGCSDPPLGAELVGFGEDVCVAVDDVVGDADCGAGGDVFAV